MANPLNVLPQAPTNTPASSSVASAANQGVAGKGNEQDSKEFSAQLAQAKEKSGKDTSTSEKSATGKSVAPSAKDSVKDTDAKTAKANLVAKKPATKEEILAAMQAQAAALASLKAQPVVAEKATMSGNKNLTTSQEQGSAKTGATAKTGALTSKAKLTPELNANLQAQLQVQSHLKGQPVVAKTAANAQTTAANANKTQVQNLEMESNHVQQAQEMAGGLAALQAQYQFEVDPAAATGEKPVAGFGKDAKVPTKFNTNDFLNLREMSHAPVKPVTAKDAISNPNQFPRFDQTANHLNLQSSLKNNFSVDGKKSKVDAMAGAMTGMSAHSGPIGSQHFAKVIDAPVTTGSQQKPVLSHDAVNQISHQVNLMSLAKQDGEIKIRLRPDHLGELQMSVRTQGQSVSIQIKAHDGEAKKIIEESLGSLKDSLAAQNLTLSSIDVVTPTTASSNQQDMNMQSDANSSRQNTDGFAGGFNGNSEQNSRQDRLFEADANQGNLNTVRNVNFGRPSSSNARGLDLIAS